jgi:hypothetical protein
MSGVPGQGTKWGMDAREKVLDLMADGMSLSAIGRLPGMPKPSTVLFWVQSDVAFAVDYARVKDVRAHVLADQALEIADDQTRDPNDRRIAVDTRKWITGIMSDKFVTKTKSDNTHAGPNGEPLVNKIEVVFVDPKG